MTSQSCNTNSVSQQWWTDQPVLFSASVLHTKSFEGAWAARGDLVRHGFLSSEACHLQATGMLRAIGVKLGVRESRLKDSNPARHIYLFSVAVPRLCFVSSVSSFLFFPCIPNLSIWISAASFVIPRQIKAQFKALWEKVYWHS